MLQNSLNNVRVFALTKSIETKDAVNSDNQIRKYRENAQITEI